MVLYYSLQRWNYSTLEAAENRYKFSVIKRFRYKTAAMVAPPPYWRQLVLQFLSWPLAYQESTVKQTVLTKWFSTTAAKDGTFQPWRLPKTTISFLL